jgi:Uma2 family endonuclease
MATALAAEPKTATAAPPRAPVVIEDRVTVPSWVHDIDSFRRWAKSDEFPERGRFSFLDGEIWVDLSMEQLFTHNDVKTQYTIVLGTLTQARNTGRFFSDGVLLTHPAANLSTEPDALFVFFESIQEGRLRLIEGAAEGYVELEGSADMTLEIISPTTERKDADVLHELYWRAHVTEYWLVDVRRKLKFDIFRWTSKGYRKTKPASGWLRSKVFDRSFRLTQESDPLGNPQFRLLVRQDDPRSG